VELMPREGEPIGQVESLAELTQAMAAGEVDTLIILDCNPVLTAPADLEFATALEQVPFRAQMSYFFDETAQRCHWHIPSLHELESWGDVRAYDGTATILQPLIAPLYGGHDSLELLALLAGNEAQTAYDLVRGSWEGIYGELDDPEHANFEQFWRTALHDGIVAGSTFPSLDVQVQMTEVPLPPVATEGIELNFRPDSTVWDGRFARNAWLQELPKHLTLLTWDNALLISPANAGRLGVTSGELVEVSFRERTIRAAIWITPGHADEAVTLHLGYGAEGVDSSTTPSGFNAYALRTSDALWFGSGVTIRPLGESYTLASTQQHDTLAGRDLVRAATLEHFLEDPQFAKRSHSVAANTENGATGTGTEEEGPPPSFYPEFAYEDNAWAMEIDLTACIGCNACTIACEIENNIPVVGKEGVLNGRLRANLCARWARPFTTTKG
jgi:hypothetical protein